MSGFVRFSQVQPRQAAKPPDERRAKARERMRMRRARETPAEAAERRRRNRERMRMRRRAAVPETLAVPETPETPPVPARQCEPPPRRFRIDPDTLRLRPPRFLRIDPHTLMPVYEDADPMAAARRIMGLP